MSDYEPEENESGEREADDAWASVMAGAAVPRAERPPGCKQDLAMDDFTEADKQRIEDAVRSLPIGPNAAKWPKTNHVTPGSPWPSPMDTPPSRKQGPSHYTGLDIQPWEAMESWMAKDEFVGFLRGNAIKYLARAPHKGGVEDYRKAKHYLEKLLSLLAES